MSQFAMSNWEKKRLMVIIMIKMVMMMMIMVMVVMNDPQPTELRNVTDMADISV